MLGGGDLFPGSLGPGAGVLGGGICFLGLSDLGRGCWGGDLFPGSLGPGAGVLGGGGGENLCRTVRGGGRIGWGDQGIRLLGLFDSGAGGVGRSGGESGGGGGAHAVQDGEEGRAGPGGGYVPWVYLTRAPCGGWGEGGTCAGS